jgi:DNA-binding MarR family transcriptional regulator
MPGMNPRPTARTKPGFFDNRDLLSTAAVAIIRMVIYDSNEMQAMNQNALKPSVAADGELEMVANEVRGLCAAITKIARRDQEQLLERHGAGISAIEHGVLRRLSQGAETLAELSRLMAVTASTLVYVIDGLAKKGLIVRKKDPGDRRRELLSFTAKGRRLLAGIPVMDAESALVKSLNGMTRREREELMSVLRKMAAGLQSAVDWGHELRAIPRAEIEPGREKLARAGIGRMRRRVS